MDEKQAIEIINSSKISYLSASIIPLLKPFVRISATRTEMDLLPLGASRLGGLPDVPKGMPWPEWQEGSLSLIAQLNLNDIASLDTGGVLPATGWLYFFYDAGRQTWGYDPVDRESWKVIYYDGKLDRLRRATPPQSSEEIDFTPCAASFKQGMSLPSFELLQPEYGIELGEEEWEHYEELHGYFQGREEEGGKHQLMGHPRTIQDDMRLQCQLVSHGLYCGDETGYSDPRMEVLALGAEARRLLLQIDTDSDGPGWMWGDMGMIYYWIHKGDLESCSFDNVWLILQCY